MEIDLHITNKCNLYCAHCVYSSCDIRMPDLSLKTIKGLVESFNNMKVKEVHVTGGEPSLNSECVDICSYLASKNFIVKIQTNGMNTSCDFAYNLKNAGVKEVLVSIDGMKKNHNNFRKNVKSFDSAMQTVTNTLKVGLKTRINTVLHKDNIDDVYDLLKLTKEIGVHQHSFFYLSPIGRGVNYIDKLLTLKEWDQISKNIYEIGATLKYLDKIKIQSAIQNTESHSNKCILGKNQMCRKDNCLILANGDVFSCVFFIYSGLKLGNIFEEELDTIWSRLDNFIEQLNANRKKQCGMSKCNGCCPGFSYLLTKDISKADPRCMHADHLYPSCIRTYCSYKQHSKK